MHDVRLEMMFEGLDVKVGDREAKSREDRVQEIADRELRKLVGQGHRMCKVAPKFVDPRLNFWNEFYTEEGLGSLEEDTNAEMEDSYDIGKPFKTQQGGQDDVGGGEEDMEMQDWDLDDDDDLPFTVEDFEREWEELAMKFDVEVLVDQGGVEDLIELMNRACVGLQVEDEAAQAVREAFDLCELSGGYV